MTTLEFMFNRILEMSTLALVAGLICLAIKNLLKKKISPKWLNYLWIAFLLILLNPIPIKSQYSIYNLFRKPSFSVSLEGDTLEQHTNPKSESIQKEKTNEAKKENNQLENQIDTIWNKVEAGWNVVVIIYWGVVIEKLVAFLWTKQKMEKETKNAFSNNRLEKILEKAKQKLDVSQNIYLVKQDKIHTPAIFDLKTPRIILQENILQLTDEEIELIFLHEIAHLKNGDIALNQLLNLLNIFYWFHPILRFLLRRIKKDIELANDEFVLEKIGNEKIKMYCKTMLKVSQFSNSKMQVALGMGSSVKELEERIKMIKEKDNFLKNKYFVTTIIVLLVSGITICFATNQALPETNVNYEEKIENQQDINFQTNENFVENSILNLIVNPLETLKVTAEYGTRIHPITKAEIIHDGVDLKAEKGEKVMAAMDGVIEETDYNSENGNYIIIKHENAAEIKYTYYAHLSEIEVEEGDFVEAGTEIGKAGNTGKSTGPHLHFKVMNEQKESIDPSTILEF